MNISKQEAVQALDAVQTTRERTVDLQNYRHFAPFLIVWGLVWLVANAISDLAPAQGGRAWLAGVVIGCVASVWQGARAPRDTGDRSGEPWRWGLTFALLLGFFIAALSVLTPATGAQINAFISLFWAFLYMVVGAWAGWRIFAIGLVMAAATLFGFFALPSHYGLWMAVVAGGALIAGGLWLRRV